MYIFLQLTVRVKREYVSTFKSKTQTLGKDTTKIIIYLMYMK